MGTSMGSQPQKTQGFQKKFSPISSCRVLIILVKKSYRLPAETAEL
jgi:hypothetical protein